MKSNPNLKPEKIRTYEFACEQYLGDHIRGTFSLFRYRIKNLIDQLTDPADGLLLFQNVGSVESNGLEMEVEGKWGKGWETRISYTYQETENSGTNATLTNSPKHLAKFNAIAPLFADKVFSGVELQYMGRRKTIAGNTVDDFFLVNLTLFSHKLLKGLEASASVYNVFNKKYTDPVGGEHLQDSLSQDGTNFRLKLTYAF